MKNILVLCSRSPVALELIRSFHRAGFRVIVADTKLSALSRWSSCKHKFIRIPPPAQEFLAFSIAIENIVRDEKITDCIPIYEESFYVAKIKDQLNCKVWMPNIKLANQLHRKDVFMELAKNYFDIPVTLNYTQFSDYDNLDQYIFKPIYSRFANNIFIKPQRSVLDKNINKNSDWIAQEFIEGQEICAYSVWDEGVMKACCFYHPKIRFGKGASILFDPEEYPILKNKIQNFGESLNYQGQLSFDFIEKNGKYYVLECNPRATSGAHLFSHHLSKIFFEDERIEQFELKSKGLKLLLLFKQPTLFFSKKYHNTQDVLFDSKDLLPMIMQTFSMIEIFTLAWRKGLSLLEATTYDIEWNGD